MALDPMTDTPEIRYFRNRLLQAREEILSLEGARDDSAATVVLDQSSVGRLSRMDAMQQQAMARDGQNRATLSLWRIEMALKRCDDGNFGICLVCNEPIDPRRLELDPTNPRCIQCARAQSD